MSPLMAFLAMQMALKMLQVCVQLHAVKLLSCGSQCGGDKRRTDGTAQFLSSDPERADGALNEAGRLWFARGVF